MTNGVMVSCSVLASDGRVSGMILFDVNNTTYNMTYSMTTTQCTSTADVMGWCWRRGGKAGVSFMLAEREARSLRCNTSVIDRGDRTLRVENITVLECQCAKTDEIGDSATPKSNETMQGQGAKTDEIGAREIVAWVMVALLALALCICGFLWLAYRRGVFKERPSPAEARAAARSMTASHRRSGSGSR